MNWIPKAKLWIVKAVQIGRLNSTGSYGPSRYIKPSEPTEIYKKDCSGCRKINFSECKVDPTGVVTAYITEICQWVVKAVQVKTMNGTNSSGSTMPTSGPAVVNCKESRSADSCVHSEMRPPALINPVYVQPTNLFIRVGMDSKIVKHLKAYFDDQIKYHKTMAKTNNAAMKKIKKLSKKWQNSFD